jgi:hypothetical protein
MYNHSCLGPEESPMSWNRAKIVKVQLMAGSSCFAQEGKKKKRVSDFIPCLWTPDCIQFICFVFIFYFILPSCLRTSSDLCHFLFVVLLLTPKYIFSTLGTRIDLYVVLVGGALKKKTNIFVILSDPIIG